MRTLCQSDASAACEEAASSLRVAEVVAALSQALDLGSGSTRWHSVRTCILGMRIAAELRLPESVQAELYYSLLMKDAGCSSNASDLYHSLESDDISAKRDGKKGDWTKTNWDAVQFALKHIAPGKPFLERVRAILRVAGQQKRSARQVTAIRCDRGAAMARLMGLSDGVADGIAGLDEHWNGGGNPNGLRGQEIPIASRIMLLAQTLDIAYTDQGAEQAVATINQRNRRWFDPEVVRAACSLARRNTLWTSLDTDNPLSLALQLEPGNRVLSHDDVTLDAICQAFAQIVDAKSPFTYDHSNGVANAAVTIAGRLGFAPARILRIRHAALLHDLGKMAVSNSILEKPGRPDEAEWQALRKHPALTAEILRPIAGFEQLAEIAASHHEKLDGTGYHRGLTAEQLPLDARILAVADVFDALSANRPYREALPREKVFEIIRKDAPHALDADCVEVLEQSRVGFDQTSVDLQSLQRKLAALDAASRKVPTACYP
ncbi:HD-GYP domain-containing protein [Nevskia soli]|uniref:HD-GYP domain-containing protein n=1 Tax=Nevskia soli TaxID=418856 RepID=UPI0015D80D2B|nr:HD-GYP domain-containing protein [Nevskia soli]